MTNIDSDNSVQDATDSNGTTEPIDGAELLDRLRDWFGRFICPVRDDDLQVLALWCAHTWLISKLFTTPRLLIDSPVYGSGKTTLLEHMERLCRNPIQMASVSPAALTRLLAEADQTLLVDETDKTFKAEGSGEIIAVINAGYKRGGVRVVSEQKADGSWVPKRLPTFSPVALAGNSQKIPDDTRQRSIRVLLLPDLRGVAAESDWELITPKAEALAKDLAAWAVQALPRMTGERPELPKDAKNRAREVWQPLAWVAKLAGGHWPTTVNALCREYLEEVKRDIEDGMVREAPATLLLRHIAGS